MRQSSCATGAYYRRRRRSRSQLSMHHCGAHRPQDLTDNLPNECMSEVLSCVREPPHVQSCAQVCWRWAYLLLAMLPATRRPSCDGEEHEPGLFLCGPEAADATLAAAVVDTWSRDAVTDLDLHWCPEGGHGAPAAPGAPQLTDRGIAFVTRACRNLKSICLCNCSSVTDGGVATIASRCPALQKLTLIRSSVTDAGVCEIAEKCTRLEFLRVEVCPSVTDLSLRALAQHAKSLASLVLGSCPRIPDNAVIAFLIERPDLTMVHLKHMIVEGSARRAAPRRRAASQSMQVEDKAALPVVLYNGFQLFHRLHRLVLTGCPGLNDACSMFARVHFPALKCLEVDDCRGMTQRGLDRLVGPAATLGAIRLRKFRFSTYAGLMQVLSLCAGTIKSLALESCAFLQVAPLRPDEPAPLSCPEMEAVRLDHCTAIVEPFLAWLGTACREVNEVGLVGIDTAAAASAVTSFLLQIAFHCKITKIELSSSPHIDDAHVSLILSVCGEALQELVLDGCPGIAGDFVPFLRASCPNVVRLGLGGTRIDDRTLSLMTFEGFELLEELGLAECDGVTDEALHVLCESRLPKLDKLDVSGCGGVTQDTVEWYRQYWDVEY